MSLFRGISRMFTPPGGGGYTPPPDNSLELERLQQQEREANRLREAQERSAREAAQRSAFNTSLSNAQNTFRTNATQRLTSLGLDPNQYGSLIDRALTGASTRVADLDPNPGQYFTDSLLDDTINREQTDRRINFGRQVASTFRSDEPFTRFNDSLDDPFIDSVLGRQRGEAVSALDNARRRGSLNDRGYEAAFARLGEMEAAGRSTANTLGGSVLQGYRDQLGEVADRARSSAGSYTLGGNFDVGTYRTRFDNLANDLSGRLEGDVSSALEGQNFFDLGDIITRGGAAQGAVNPRTELADVLAQRARTRTNERGVGASGSGVF
jgi:hypothetical protein